MEINLSHRSLLTVSIKFLLILAKLNSPRIYLLINKCVSWALK
jgi:hypothetical protein